MATSATQYDLTLADPDAKHLNGLITSLQAKVNELVKDTSGARDQWPKTVESTIGQLSTQIGIVSTAVSRLDSHTTAVLNELGDVTEAAKRAADTLKPQRDSKTELGFDLGRLLVLAILTGLASVSIAFRTSAHGWIAIFITDAWISSIIVWAAVTSNTYYRLANQLGDRFCQVMPTKAFAVPFVFGLFVVLWIGFAGIYASSTDFATFGLYTANTARYQSFATLMTLNTGSECILSEGMQFAVAAQITSAVLLFIGVFAIVINRISDF
jgi:hypothetical protein